MTVRTPQKVFNEVLTFNSVDVHLQTILWALPMIIIHLRLHHGMVIILIHIISIPEDNKVIPLLDTPFNLLVGCPHHKLMKLEKLPFW